MAQSVKETKPRPSSATLPDVDMQGRVMPQAIDFEDAVLGAMLLDSNATVTVIDKLHEDMFYKDSHRRIFAAILKVFSKHDPVDLLSVSKQLRQDGVLEQVGGAYYLASLTNRVVSSANIEYHARILMEKYIQRKLIEVSTETIRNAYDNSLDVWDMLDHAEQQLFDIAEQNFQQSHQQVSDLIQSVLNEMQQMKLSGDKLRGLPSGFTDLDRVTNGWQKATLNIIAARPGMGKTAFILSMARKIAVRAQRPLAIFSLEMSATDLVVRLISAESRLKQNQLKSGDLNDRDWATLINSTTDLQKARLIIDDTAGLSIFELRAKCRRFKQQYGIQAVIIDYLQLMTAGTDMKGNREQEISTISRSLKALSKELEIPVIALSQLNRGVESRGSVSKRPQLSDLRESGAIEQDADIVMFIYRPEYYKIETFEDGTPSAGMAELMIAKHRNGATGDIRLRFIADYAEFCDTDTVVQQVDAGHVPLPVNPDEEGASSAEESAPRIIHSRINNASQDEDEYPF